MKGQSNIQHNNVLRPPTYNLQKNLDT